MKEDENKPKERFRNFRIRFNEPLSNLVLEQLPKKIDFISKYRDFNIIKINDNITGMIFKDSLSITYVLDSEELKANSSVRKDEKVAERLEETANRILKISGYEEKGYELIEGLDFLYIDNFKLQEKIEHNLLKSLQKFFEKDGTIYLSECIFTLRAKDKNIPIRLTYPTYDDLDNNRLLVESDKNYIKNIKKVLTNGT